MADDRHGQIDDPSYRRTLARLRVVAIAVDIALLALYVIAVIVGSFIRPDFHVGGDFVFGVLVGSLLLMLGVEGVARFPFGITFK